MQAQCKTDVDALMQALEEIAYNTGCSSESESERLAAEAIRAQHQREAVRTPVIAHGPTTT